jgi:hypothetical protein
VNTGFLLSTSQTPVTSKAPLAACGDRAGSRRVRHTLLSLWLASLISVASAKYATSTESCFYPNVGTIFSSPGSRLGEFHLALDPPDYTDPQSAQNHLSYSAILSRLLEQALPEQTDKFCHAGLNENYYPDLYVFLTRAKAGGNVEDDRGRCSRALLDVLAQLQPDEKAVATAAAQEADRRVRAWSDPTDPLSVLLRALSRVYVRDSFFRALLESDPARLRSVSSTAFLSWLDRQRAIKRDKLTPIRQCGPEPGRDIAGGDADAMRLPRSNVVPPGTFDVSIVPSSTVTTRALRHLVIVGSNQPLPLAPLSAPATDKFCNRDVVIPPNGEPATARGSAVTIKCLQLRVDYTDFWIAFYCSPEDGHSDADEKVALTAVATDPAVAALGHDDPGDSAFGPRGPYFVNVRVGAE